jgi:hypothetical protein
MPHRRQIGNLIEYSYLAKMQEKMVNLVFIYVLDIIIVKIFKSEKITQIINTNICLIKYILYHYVLPEIL